MLQNSVKPVCIRHIGEYLSQHTAWHRCRLHVTRDVLNVHVCVSAVEMHCVTELRLITDSVDHHCGEGNHKTAVRHFQVCHINQQFLLHFMIIRPLPVVGGLLSALQGVYLSLACYGLYWLLISGVSWLRNVFSTCCLSLCRAVVSSSVSVSPVPSPLNEKNLWKPGCVQIPDPAAHMQIEEETKTVVLNAKTFFGRTFWLLLVHLQLHDD